MRFQCAVETLRSPRPSVVITPYRIVRDDGRLDNMAGQAFSTYASACDVLERYYGDLCCSDGREYYKIEEDSETEELADGQPG